MTKQCRILAGVGTVAPLAAMIVTLVVGCMSGGTPGLVALSPTAESPRGTKQVASPSAMEVGRASVSDIVPVAHNVPVVFNTAVPVAMDGGAMVTAARMPCGCPGGCVCVPNARCYGYFPTSWRRWPCDPTPNVVVPRSAGGEPVVAPPVPTPAPVAPPAAPEESEPEKEPPTADLPLPTPAEQKPILPPTELRQPASVVPEPSEPR